MGKIYAAYASNINIPQMRYRVGRNAYLLGKAWLRDFELCFRGDRAKTAVATIAPKDGSAVPVLLWWINEEAERLLNCYEGVPTHYRQETVRLEYGGFWLDEVMVYEMVPGKPLNSPSEQYYQTIVEGYLMQRMPLQILEEARDRSTKK